MATSVAPQVLILGANGRFGRSATAAFARAGWQVIAHSRQAPRDPLPMGARALVCEVDAASVTAAARNAQVIVNALNPDYTRWEALYPPLAARALQLARASGALLMLPGNVYNFGRRLPPDLTETTPQVPDTPRARVRIALEDAMRAAAAEGVDSVVLRAGDFFGGLGPGTWLDLAIAKSLARGRIVYPGAMEQVHAWAYLPDLAQTFVALAQLREALRGFNAFHFGGHSVTGAAFCAALVEAVGHPLRVGAFPWWQLRLAAPFAPMLRAILEMRYLWQRPHRLVDQALREFLGGAVQSTPLPVALAHALNTA